MSIKQVNGKIKGTCRWERVNTVSMCVMQGSRWWNNDIPRVEGTPVKGTCRWERVNTVSMCVMQGSRWWNNDIPRVEGTPVKGTCRWERVNTVSMCVMQGSRWWNNDIPRVEGTPVKGTCRWERVNTVSMCVMQGWSITRDRWLAQRGKWAWGGGQLNPTQAISTDSQFTGTFKLILSCTQIQKTFFQNDF